MTDSNLLREVAKASAPWMQKEDGRFPTMCPALKNLLVTAIVWGFKAHERGWNIETAIEEGAKL